MREALLVSAKQKCQLARGGHLPDLSVLGPPCTPWLAWPLVLPQPTPFLKLRWLASPAHPTSIYWAPALLPGPMLDTRTRW